MAYEGDQFYKIKLCPFLAQGKCRKGDSCRYAHSPDELCIAVSLKKTKLCEAWKRGHCQQELCKFAHGEAELRSTPDYYKTSICKFWSKGHCGSGSACRHAHGAEELRETTFRRKNPESIRRKQSEKRVSVHQPASFHSQWYYNSQQTLQPSIDTQSVLPFHANAPWPAGSLPVSAMYPNYYGSSPSLQQQSTQSINRSPLPSSIISDPNAELCTSLAQLAMESNARNSNVCAPANPLTDCLTGNTLCVSPAEKVSYSTSEMNALLSRFMASPTAPDAASTTVTSLPRTPVVNHANAFETARIENPCSKAIASSTLHAAASEHLRMDNILFSCDHASRQHPSASDSLSCAAAATTVAPDYTAVPMPTLPLHQTDWKPQPRHSVSTFSTPSSFSDQLSMQKLRPASPVNATGALSDELLSARTSSVSSSSSRTKLPSAVLAALYDTQNPLRGVPSSLLLQKNSSSALSFPPMKNDTLHVSSPKQFDGPTQRISSEHFPPEFLSDCSFRSPTLLRNNTTFEHTEQHTGAELPSFYPLHQCKANALLCCNSKPSSKPLIEENLSNSSTAYDAAFSSLCSSGSGSPTELRCSNPWAVALKEDAKYAPWERDCTTASTRDDVYEFFGVPSDFVSSLFRDTATATQAQPTTLAISKENNDVGCY